MSEGPTTGQGRQNYSPSAIPIEYTQLIVYLNYMGLALQCYVLARTMSSRWCGAVIAEEGRFLFPAFNSCDVELIILVRTPAGRMWQVCCLA